MPRVSIIVNVYNGEATLRETLESIFAQTFSDWELIVWDDCSTDGSAAIIRECRDARIASFRSEVNRGLAASRVAALERATGDWFAFVDQDDLWTPDKLALQVARAEQVPDAGFVYGRAVRFYPDGRKLDYDHRHEFSALPEGNIFERLFVDSCFIAISTVLFRRSAFDAIPPMPSYISACPDYYLYVAIAKAHPVAAVQSVVCYYRVHAGNMTHTHNQRMQREILQLIEDWSPHLPAGLAARRRRVHCTVLAQQQMRSLRTFTTGLATLVRGGAWSYLLSRPFARAFRAVRRRLRTPYWRRAHDVAPGLAPNPT